MRTHSAPPDEHAGIFEVGGNGIRYPYGMQQVHLMIDFEYFDVVFVFGRSMEQ
jgi:hypothetical protein